MNIALDGRAAQNDITGVGEFIIHLTQGLLKKGHQVTLIYSHPPKHKIIGTEDIIVPGDNRFKWEQRQLIRVLNQLKPDIYHATWNYGIPIGYRGKTVLTVHDLIPLFWKRYFLSKRITQFPEYITSLLISVCKANHIFVVSNYSAHNLYELFPFTKKKSEVVPLGFENLFSTSDEYMSKVVKKYACTHPYIIYFGGIDKRKNIDGLMRAFAKSRTKETHDLVIVGRRSGYYLPFAKQLSIQSKTHFIDYVEEREKFALLKSAALFVYPSLYEGFGIPPLEAMSVGTPVITSNLSSIPETTGDAALLIDPKDENELVQAINTLTTDAVLQQKLTAKGYKQIKMFSWEKMTDKIITAYKNI